MTGEPLLLVPSRLRDLLRRLRCQRRREFDVVNTLGLERLPGRCPVCAFHLATQGCACEGQRLKFSVLAATLDANSDDASRVDAAVRQLASTGRPFSANDARSIHGVRGGTVGATFNALHAAKVIRPVGNETSTNRGTHGKTVALWVGVAA